MKVADLERVIGEPATAWYGRCHEIAVKSVLGGFVHGRPVYGHYRGPTCEAVIRSCGVYVGFVHQGWVELDDGRVFDPTRFHNEGVEPYLYVGPADPAVYDENGDVFRSQVAKLYPIPPYIARERVDLTFGGDPVREQQFRDWMSKLIGQEPPWSMQQVVWMAKLPTAAYGFFAAHFLKALKNADLESAMPAAGRMMVAATRYSCPL